MTAKTMMDTAAGAGAMSLPWWAGGPSDWAQLVAVGAGSASAWRFANAGAGAGARGDGDRWSKRSSIFV